MYKPTLCNGRSNFQVGPTFVCNKSGNKPDPLLASVARNYNSHCGGYSWEKPMLHMPENLVPISQKAAFVHGQRSQRIRPFLKAIRYYLQWRHLAAVINDVILFYRATGRAELVCEPEVTGSIPATGDSFV